MEGGRVRERKVWKEGWKEGENEMEGGRGRDERKDVRRACHVVGFVREVDSELLVDPCCTYCFQSNNVRVSNGSSQVTAKRMSELVQESGVLELEIATIQQRLVEINEQMRELAGKYHIAGKLAQDTSYGPVTKILEPCQKWNGVPILSCKIWHGQENNTMSDCGIYSCDKRTVIEGVHA